MLESVINGELTASSFLLCSAASLVLGIAAAAAFMYKNRAGAGFAVTLALLPLMVQAVVMMVNGNIGAGVAVAGAFSLVRFRSAPGSAREIAAIFLAMTLGIVCGMGYLAVALAVLVISCSASMLLSALGFGERRGGGRMLRLTVPESLDFAGAFDDVFEKYLSGSELVRIKTDAMGSIYDLRYRVTLRDFAQAKSFIDELRERNGNLPIILGNLPEKEEM